MAESSCEGCDGNHLPYRDRETKQPIAGPDEDDRHIYTYYYHYMCKCNNNPCPCTQKILDKVEEEVEEEKKRVKEEKKRALEEKRAKIIEGIKSAPTIPVWFTDLNDKPFKLNVSALALSKFPLLNKQVCNTDTAKYEIQGQVDPSIIKKYILFLIDPIEFPYDTRDLKELKFLHVIGDNKFIKRVASDYIKMCSRECSGFPDKVHRFLRNNSALGSFLWTNCDRQYLAEMLKANKHTNSFIKKSWDEIPAYVKHLSRMSYFMDKADPDPWFQASSIMDYSKDPTGILTIDDKILLESSPIIKELLQKHSLDEAKRIISNVVCKAMDRIITRQLNMN